MLVEISLSGSVARDPAAIELSGAITALGGFRSEIADLLDYPAGYYHTTPPDTPVHAQLFGIDGTEATTEFARLLGISDPWDFNQHRVDPGRIDVGGLRAFLGGLEGSADWLRQVESLVKLRDAGFVFYFRPIYELRWEQLERDHVYPATPPWRIF